MGFVQWESSGQLGTGQASCSIAFDNPNVGGNAILVITGWENSGPNPSAFKSSNGNNYIPLSIHTAGGHLSQALYCPSCKQGFETVEIDFPAPGGDHPSVTIAEYGASDIQLVKPTATGVGSPADAGSVSVPSLATVVQLTDTTQDTFAAGGSGFTLRTNDGTSAPMRQAIIDGQLQAGTCDPQTILGGAAAPWATTIFVLTPTGGKRETVANALISLLATATINGSPAFVKVGRNAKIWSNVDAADQPAMYLIHYGDSVVQKQSFGLPKYTFHFVIMIYIRADAGPDAVPDTVINQMLDAIGLALQSIPPGEKQTLGGLVENAWVEGEILIDSGILDQQCVIQIPVKVVTGI